MVNQGLRYSVVVIILIALGGGIWTRHRFAAASQPSSSEEIGPGLERPGVKAPGSFEEPVTGMAGFEFPLAGCERPVGVLPVPASNAAIIPAAFRYKPGDYEISYLYNGQAYPEAGISYRLTLLYALNRIRSFLGLMDGEPFAFYLKIWTPSDCPGLSTFVESRLEQGFIAAQRPSRN